MISLPPAFVSSPRFWGDGAAWLAGLPGAVLDQCSRWGLRISGDPWHGSNAIVFPVVRDAVPLVLRLTPPGPSVSAEVAALRFWNGRGTVLLFDADESRRAMLLERLSPSSLLELPVEAALAELGRMMRRLAVPAPRSRFRLGRSRFRLGRSRFRLLRLPSMATSIAVRFCVGLGSRG